ncbi:hypothetical protein [Streptomyces sp. NPDC002521]
MGERHSGDGPFGRWHGHPGGTLSAPDHVDGYGHLTASGCEAWLAAALRVGGVDAEAERRAVAAFRAAREPRVSAARTRRRDDWRPAVPRRGRRSLRTTLSVALASLALGGVAVAAIGSARSGPDARPDTPRPARPSASGPHRSAAPGASAGTTGPGSASPAGRPHHPATARDTVAHCRTYERSGERGGALDATAWQRLVAAAGGTDKVASYCATQVTNGTTGNGRKVKKGAKPGESGAGPESHGDNSKPKPVAGGAKPETGSGKSAPGAAKPGDARAKAANGG